MKVFELDVDGLVWPSMAMLLEFSQTLIRYSRKPKQVKAVGASRALEMHPSLQDSRKPRVVNKT
jgi:hypothetical protein